MGISVRNVEKRFGTFTALGDVSVDVPDGSLTALLGPSGSGKSTLLRVIAGLEQPDKGEVHIGGQAVTNLPPQKRGIGFVFQHYAAFKHMTLRDNVAFGLTIRKRPKDQVRRKLDELLELVGLAADLDLAAVWPLEPGDDAQERRLAGPRRPQQRRERAVGNVDRDVVESEEVAEALRDVVDLDHVVSSLRRFRTVIATSVASAIAASSADAA